MVSSVTQLRRDTTIYTTLWTEKDSECRAGVPQLPITIAMVGTCVEVAHHLTESQLHNSAVPGPYLISALHHPRPGVTLLIAGQDSRCEMPHSHPSPESQTPAHSPWAHASKEEIGVPSPVPTLNTAGGVVAVGPSQPHPAVPSGQVVNVA